MRVALVTGAARGIGAATVDLLAGNGYAVLAVDACQGPAAQPYPMPTAQDLDAVAAPYENVVAHQADVRVASSMHHAVALAVERWGRLDAAVCAAAVLAGGKPLWETPLDALDLLWDVDARGVWNTARAAVPVMLEGPNPASCRFVAVASAAGSRGLHHLAAYTTVKHAVVGLVRGLAADLVGSGVTAVAVSPGSTRTAMLDQTAQLYRVGSAEDFAQHQLVRRLLEPREVAKVIAFCCSSDGGLLNGSVVHADGGFEG